MQLDFEDSANRSMGAGESLENKVLWASATVGKRAQIQDQH